MAKHYAQLLLLFILLISALGCYCAFSKQLPDEEEGLSKLKLISRNLKGNKVSANNERDADNDVRTVFDNIVQKFPEFVIEIRQRCESTECTTVEDDQACIEVYKDVGSTVANPICGSCVDTKCTYPEVVTEQESNEADTEETTQVMNE